jgi:hypothetical protein
MDVFESCRAVNSLLSAGSDVAARDELIKLLAALDEEENVPYTPLINRLIRDVGLYPYMEISTAGWEERYIYEVFKADVGENEPVTLHLEQRRLLDALVAGRSIAVSAPTSFGKSFVIDAFIALKRPTNVVILVPTIALADETRRRLQRKFGGEYKIITMADQDLAEANILIFPQERAIGYANQLQRLDILIVDEFYKASKAFDKERAPALIRSILEFSRIANQRYYLAPNISVLAESEFTKGMEFVKLDFHTVFLEMTELYREIGRDEVKKSSALLKILLDNEGKSLIYAGSYPQIKQVANLLMAAYEPSNSKLLLDFQSWLAKHYGVNWDLAHLVARGVGIHNGQLHRSLSQIQIRLFEDENGLGKIISTSSIIEGVNTSAKNVILWSNKNGNLKLNDFTYRNIIGRGGRMFRHFVGRIFILEPPPAAESTQLHLEYPDELLGLVDESKVNINYTPEQVARIRAYEERMRALVEPEDLAYLQSGDVLQTSDTELIVAIAQSIRNNSKSWNGLRHLNSDDPNSWDRLLYKLFELDPSAWETKWVRYIAFLKALSGNWSKTIPELLDDLSEHEIGIEEFFKLERVTTFRLAALLGDVQTIYNRINKSNPVELAPAITRFSHAFLPRVVYQLEEYGLPRMLSRKICKAGVVALDEIPNVHDATRKMIEVGLEKLSRTVEGFDSFDVYILRYFFEGLSSMARDVAQQ